MTTLEHPQDPAPRPVDGGAISTHSLSAFSVLTLAAVCSAGAGLVHAAAAGTHTGDTTLVWLFSFCAVAQLGWAVATFTTPRPGRMLAAIGIALNLTIALGWVLSRTTGLPLVDSLSAREVIGVQDALATALELGAVGLAAVALFRNFVLGRAAFLGIGALLLAPTLIGMTAPHSHGGSHDHGHGDTEVAADGAGHDHSDAAAHGDGVAHDDSATHEDGATHDEDSSGGHDHSAASAAVDPVFTGADVSGIPEDQLDEAAALIVETREAVVAGGFTDIASVEAAGYVSIGDGRRTTGVVYEHFINPAYLSDGQELDPAHIESFVFEVTDGVKVLSTAMYVLDTGSTMADAPDIAGELTMWHDHQNLCWDATGTRLAGIVRDGACVPGGTFRGTSPMLHVWLQDNECGPFAGVEGHGSTEQASCTSGHTHTG